MTSQPAQVRRLRVPIVATLVVAAAVALMIGLGIWQLRRADWKTGLIAQYQQAQTIPSPVAWPRTDDELEHSLFRQSQFNCLRVIAMRTTAATAVDGSKGVAQIARCAIDGGGEAQVALGWSLPTAPFSWNGGEVRGVIAPHGVLHTAEPASGLKPLARPDPNDLPNNHLMYAGQWFLFALTALVIYVLALRKRMKG